MQLRKNLEDVKNSYSKEEIVSAIDITVNSIAEFYASIPEEFFFTTPKDGWAPEKNVRHLTKSTLPIYLGMKGPKFALLIFGTNKNKSQNMEAVINLYLSKLSQGAGVGIFEPFTPSAKGNKEKKEKLISSLKESGMNLKNVLDSWSEEELDSYKMPHPILGNITVREMNLFAIYHFFHHTNNVLERMKQV
ncbi:MAG: DinB family protein [Leptospiraceae bacterium]|nr:DinB family protein [Leptospiraceae bacterium]